MEKKEGNIKKNFSVPAGYFDGLEKNVLSKTVDAPKTDVRSRFVQPWMAIAASVLIIFCIGAAWMWNSDNQQVVGTDDIELDFLEGMEDELFAALIFEADGVEEESSLEALADFLVELEQNE